MIFPKQQMKIEQQAKSFLKKEAIELIIELYLSRKKVEDIDFLKNNFGTTHDFVTSIGSSLETGLTLVDLQNSKLIYGENQKKSPSKCLNFFEYLHKEFTSPFLIIGLILLLSGLAFATVRKLEQLYSSSLILILFSVAVTLIRVSVSFYWSHCLSKSSLSKIKNNFYQVIRNGKYMEVQESQIAVGDIIELGFKEKVPTTGILLSTTQIYVKEQNKNSVAQLKLNLQRCLRKIQSMSILDFKLNHEQKSLPSPLIIRGSELVKGSTYAILVISVTQEQLLEKYGYNNEDQFSSKIFNRWIGSCYTRWIQRTLILILFTTILIAFTQMTNFKLMAKNKSLQFEIFFQFLLKISILLLILNSLPVNSFLNQIFLKLMNELDVIENFEKFFTVQRILCNERKIIEHDNIISSQLAVGDKMDLISMAEINNLHPSTGIIIQKMKQVFNIKNSSNFNQMLAHRSGEKCRKIIHTNKKDLKIISVLSENKDNAVFQTLKSSMTKNKEPSKLSEHKSTYLKNKDRQNKQKVGSCNFLKLPSKINSDMQQLASLKEIIHEKCRIKSRIILDGLTGLIEDDLKTYYFQVFDLKALDQINFIAVEGKVKPMTTQYKQRLMMLSRKMILVYNLTPVILSYNEGHFNKNNPRILICINGVIISQNNQIINSLNELSHVGIQSVILVNRALDDQQDSDKAEESIIQEYKARKWLQDGPLEVSDCSSIKEILKRLVCKDCWISNCDCKEKIEVAMNIQPFIQVVDKLKVIYNVEQVGLTYLESAYGQIDSNTLHINSVNSSVTDSVSSIFSSLRFFTSLKRSLVFFKVISLVCFFVPVMFWIRDCELVSPAQIGVPFLFLLTLFSNAFLISPRGNLQKVKIEENGKIKIINQQLAMLVFSMCCFTTIGSQLLELCSSKIPEYTDGYDELIHKNGLSPQICKYGESGSVTSSFEPNLCSTPEIGEQYSRLSTIIITYVYFCLWAFAVFLNRNFKSFASLLLYFIGLLLFIVGVEKAPSLLHGYSYGLAWQHYFIASISALATLILALLIGVVFTRLPIVSYFEDDIETELNFNHKDQNRYIHKLKNYSQKTNQQKQSLKELSFKNIFKNV